jgi:hypothetical protein
LSYNDVISDNLIFLIDCDKRFFRRTLNAGSTEERPFGKDIRKTENKSGDVFSLEYNNKLTIVLEFFSKLLKDINFVIF